MPKKLFFKTFILFIANLKNEKILKMFQKKISSIGNFHKIFCLKISVFSF